MADEDHARRSRRPLLLGLVAAAVLVALVVWLATRGDGASSTASSGASPAAPSGAASGAPSDAAPTTAVPKRVDTRAPTPSPVVKHPPKPVRAGLGSEKTLTTGVAVDVVRTAAVRGKARGVGEVAGPALRLTVKVRNTGTRPVDLDLAVVTAYSGPKDAPANELSGPGARPFPQSLAPGAAATGVFVFAVPPRQRDRLRVDFTYSAAAPRVVFTGSARG